MTTSKKHIEWKTLAIFQRVNVNEDRRTPGTSFPKFRTNKWVWFRCFEHCLQSGTNLNRQPQIVSHSRRCLFFPLLLVIRDASQFLPSLSLSLSLSEGHTFAAESRVSINICTSAKRLSLLLSLSLTTRRNLSGGCVFQWDDTECRRGGVFSAGV